MRLICPNCDAQYEVDDAAIPAAGRDVQCSSCGHGWFQAHPGVEAERAAESALHDAPAAETVLARLSATDDGPAGDPVIADVVKEDGTATDSTVEDSTPEASVAEDSMAEDAAVDQGTSEPPVATVPQDELQSRQIDEAVLAVLREEAERETIARRLDAEAALETQTDLGIDDAAAAPAKSATARHIARLKGEDPDAAPEPEPEIKRELSRREMLPNIEEINYSLRPGEVAVDDDGEAYEIVRRPAPRSGFRSGFVLMLVLAGLIIAVYVMAPRIAEQIPAAKPTLDIYVAGVDSARSWLDAATRSVVTSLRGLAGTDQQPPP